MKRITLSILTSMLFAFLLIVCSSNDDTAFIDTSDEVNETTDEKVNEEESDDDDLVTGVFSIRKIRFVTSINPFQQ